MRHFDHIPVRIPLLSVMLALLAWSLASCASPLDLSQEQVAAPGPEWGIVIGSVLVRQERTGSGSNIAADTPSPMYEFDVVQTQPADPNGEGPYVSRYHVDATAGQERPFLARLRPGHYLMKNFHRTGMSGTGGDLNLVFESQSGRVVYVGQVVVDVPSQLAHGKEYRFSVQDAHDATFAQLTPQHGHLTQQAITAPMQIRPSDTP
ncbi:MAG: hypothetical protein JSR62_14485 [Nitrospira sp.]|nr:hypothetical protein [Nitrospira sp.]